MVADLAAISKEGVLTPGLGVRGTWGSGWAHSIARPWVPISAPLTHRVYLVPFVSYLAGSKSVSARRRPSDVNTMTNTALEGIASSSGNNRVLFIYIFMTSFAPSRFLEK